MASDSDAKLRFAVVSCSSDSGNSIKQTGTLRPEQILQGQVHIKYAVTVRCTPSTSPARVGTSGWHMHHSGALHCWTPLLQRRPPCAHAYLGALCAVVTCNAPPAPGGPM
jgi:hypothetical protein